MTGKRVTVTYSVEVAIDGETADAAVCADVLRDLSRADVGRVVGASWTTYTYEDVEPGTLSQLITGSESHSLDLGRDGDPDATAGRDGVRVVRDSQQA